MGNTTCSSPATSLQGRDGRALAQGGIIATLIESARRQECLIDVLAAAVESGSETAILEAARSLAANRRKEFPAPLKQRERKPKGLDLEM